MWHTFVDFGLASVVKKCLKVFKISTRILLIILYFRNYSVFAFAKEVSVLSRLYKGDKYSKLIKLSWISLVICKIYKETTTKLEDIKKYDVMEKIQYYYYTGISLYWVPASHLSEMKIQKCC